MMGKEAQGGAVSVDQARDGGVSLAQCSTDLNVHRNHLEGMLQLSLLAPLPEFLIQ